MKLVYMAHPLTTYGTIEENQQAIDLICKQIVIDNPDIVPISPIHAFSFYDPAGCQETVINYCKALLSTCQEIWLYGHWRESKGCQVEVEHARKQGIVVRDKNEVTSWKIIDTDNFDGDYPDEKVVIENLRDLEQANMICRALIDHFCYDGCPRYYKVVDDGYKLQPGFEP